MMFDQVVGQSVSGTMFYQVVGQSVSGAVMVFQACILRLDQVVSDCVTYRGRWVDLRRVVMAIQAFPP